MVRCNATRYFEQDSVGSSFFGGIASESLSLEKTNALSPSVEIDTNRTTKITNKEGVANINMMIL